MNRRKACRAKASQACDAGSIPVARSSYVAPFLRTAFFVALRYEVR